MERSSRSTHRSGTPNSRISNPETLLQTAETKSSFQVFGRSCAEKLQPRSENQLYRLLMKEEQRNVDTILPTQESPISVQDETRPICQPFSNAQSAFVRQTMTTLKASVAVKVRAQTLGAMVSISLGRPEKDNLEGSHSSISSEKSPVARWCHLYRWHRLKMPRRTPWRSTT